MTEAKRGRAESAPGATGEGDDVTERIRLDAVLEVPPEPEALRRRSERRRLLEKVKASDPRAAKVLAKIRAAATTHDTPTAAEAQAWCKLVVRQVETLKKHGIRHENEVAALADSIRGWPYGVPIPSRVRDYIADFLEVAVEWYYRGSKRKRAKPTKALLEARARRADVVFWKGGSPRKSSFLDLMTNAAVIDLLQKFGLEQSREAAFKEVARQLGITASQVRERYYKIKGRTGRHGL